jgi:DNA-binding PadR family transcriptional regulator
MNKPETKTRSRPLSSNVVHILLTLLEGDRHGYAIKQEVERRTDGAVRLGPGTLYEAIQRLESEELIEESHQHQEEDTNAQKAQRRYYRLTPKGLDRLRAEVASLGRLVDYARTRRELQEPKAAQ